MDAVRLNFNRISLFLAFALLLLTPAQSHAQELAASTTAVTIGNASCNSFYDLILTSSTGAVIPYTVKVQYNGSTPATGDQYGNWLYARTIAANGDSTGATSTGTAIDGTTFAVTSGNPTGASKVRVGLNLSLGGATSDAYVIVHPTNGAPDLTIHVFYTQNIGCGANTGQATNGYVTITPGNVALTTGTSNSQNGTLTIANTTATPLTFEASAQGASWLTITVPSVNIPGNGSATVTVTGNGALVAGAGTYNGAILITTKNGGTSAGSPLNIPVVLTVTTSGGGGGTSTGTLTLNGTTSNVYNASFSYLAPNVPGAICIPIQDTAAGANSYTYSAVTASGGDWLRANYQTSGSTTGSLAASANACVTVNLSNTISSVPTGSYTGTINLTSVSGSTAQINVTLYDISAPAAPGVTVSPQQNFQFGNVASGSTGLQQQTFTITAASGYTLGTALATTNPGWFTMTPPTVNGNTETFTVTANPTGLANGVYYAIVNVSSGGTASGTTSILITLPVGQPGATTGGGVVGVTTVAPTSLSFLEQQGDSFWTGGQETQNVTLVGPAGTTWTASISYGAGASNWLTLKTPCAGSPCTGTFTSSPSTLPVDLFNAQSLTASSTPYTATINITSASGNVSIGVSLLVTATNTPVLYGLPALRTFSSTSGSVPANLSVQVVGSDNTASPTSPTITAGAPTVSWVTAVTNGNVMTLAVNPTGQATGTYWGTIPVRASAYADTLNYPVVLIINGGGGGTPAGPLTLSTTSIPFTNVTTVNSQTLNITAAISTSFTAAASTQSCTNANWLGISPGGALTASTNNTPITVTVNPAGISNGSTCLGIVTLSTTSATQNVNVSMTVGAAQAGPEITLTPTNLNFSYIQNQAIPAGQTVSVTNAVAGTSPIPFTIATAVSGGGLNWLGATAASASTPYTATISVSPGSLNPGSYNGTVTFTPSSGGSAKVVNVTLTVSSAPTVVATPTSVNLSYTVGGTVPTATIQVSGGGATANFTAVASSTNNWLKVSPTSGTTPNTGNFPLTISIDPNVSLNPNTYTGTVTVAGVSPATGTTLISVTLTVTSPLPTIAAVTNAASGAVGGVSPGEIISIFADPTGSHPIGPAASVKLDSTTCPNPCTQVPFIMGGVKVTFLPIGRPAPMLFVSAGQINAVVPYDIAGIANLSVKVEYLGQSSNAFPLQSAVTAPGVFTANASGAGPAAVNMYDATGVYKGVNSVQNPAQKGWILAIYLTGEGKVSPQPADGAVIVASSGTPVTPQPLFAPTVLIDSNPATVTGYGEVAGLVNGVLQVNAIVPPGVRSGPVTLSVNIGSGATTSSQANVTVAIQ